MARPPKEREVVRDGKKGTLINVTVYQRFVPKRYNKKT